MQPKLLPTEINEELFYEKLAAFPETRTVEKFITSTYSGIATQIAHELTYRASGAIDVPVAQVDKGVLYTVFSAWQQLLINEDYKPTIAIDKTGKPIDYSYMDITYLGDAVTYRTYDTLSQLFDHYFAEKDRLEKIHQRAHDIRVLVANAKARTEKKLSIQREALRDSERAETYKRKGDLITANLYRIKRGDAELCATDYYDEQMPEVTVELDTRLSPSANAQRMYKLYTKARNAKVILTEQIALWEAELKYLETVCACLEAAQTEQDIADIRDELFNAGYASRMRGYKPPRQMRSHPITMTTTDGKRLIIGKNNVQNDRLTMREASKDDIWFHVKDIPGSHVILVTDGEEPTDRDYTEAAAIAAGYSQATGDLVAVDYTRVRNIRKPAGSKPGFVTYKTNFTAYVKPIKSIGD
jgi:predicted ribosome quality control (RQC) complex YloA/Tae2 family protein